MEYTSLEVFLVEVINDLHKERYNKALNNITTHSQPLLWEGELSRLIKRSQMTVPNKGQEREILKLLKGIEGYHSNSMDNSLLRFLNNTNNNAESSLGDIEKIIQHNYLGLVHWNFYIKRIDSLTGAHLKYSFENFIDGLRLCNKGLKEKDDYFKKMNLDIWKAYLGFNLSKTLLETKKEEKGFYLLKKVIRLRKRNADSYQKYFGFGKNHLYAELGHACDFYCLEIKDRLCSQSIEKENLKELIEYNSTANEAFEKVQNTQKDGQHRLAAYHNSANDQLFSFVKSSLF